MERYSDEILGSLGDELKGRKIALCVTGSISAFKAAEIARMLRRYGAEVIAVMSEDAMKIIHKNLMEWATGNRVVTELTGEIEHVALTSGKGSVDAVLVAPATANTVSKIANGIDDTPVTSVVSSALGAKIPILVAPAMHETMTKNPAVISNIERLGQLGITFIPSRFEEGKAKIAEEEKILDYVIFSLTDKDMKGKRVLVTGGPTREKIDPVRFITNGSSGKTGIAIAKNAAARGADVTLVTGPTQERIPEWIDAKIVESAREMHDAVVEKMTEKRYDIFVASAAVSDYTPSSPAMEKIDSEGAEKITIELTRTPKIIDVVKRISSDTMLVIFKAEYNVSKDELIRRGMERVRKTDADIAVLNDVSKGGFGSDINQVIILRKDGSIRELPAMRKNTIARIIMDEVMQLIKKR